MARNGSPTENGVLLEFIPHGTMVKVCAVDPVTSTEVISIGPATASQEQLSRLAVNKLKYVMRRRGLLSG